ncbi:DUF402 domain-containing protein [Bacillus sp. KH172YL63]|uniref:DUF402 domain-containing protein n=1 Tax=Bacillus sp. KH172YL63 TaxID=2709784 RepID=UPI0013E4622E|nr:DUF402 domain-containing protein [Bacillus sp. KH172YL63]BCB04310.1 hypothetical protein KH172YL63_24430 [Bacillus sp. KH172YL63]
MLKRKYGLREGWSRILKQHGVTGYTPDKELEGYLSLITFDEVTEPLSVNYDGTSICIADKGYSWLQFFPADQHYSITTMMDGDSSIIQWYIDITKENGYCEEKGPWMDDLFLDLIVLPDGTWIEKDEEELEEAYQKGVIDKTDYLLAINEYQRFKMFLDKKELDLRELTSFHLETLHS